MEAPQVNKREAAQNVLMRRTRLTEHTTQPGSAKEPGALAERAVKIAAANQGSTAVGGGIDEGSGTDSFPPMARSANARDEQLFEFMVKQARLRDRLYFASDSTAAKALGCSRHTIIRARARLEAAGRIERCGWRVMHRKRIAAYRFPPGVKRLSATQRSSTNCRKASNPGSSPREEQPHYVRLTRNTRRTWHRRRTWRRMMGEVVPISGTPERKPPTAGQALFTAIVDTLNGDGIRLPRSIIAIAAKQGAEALEDGIEPDVVLSGCLLALQQGKSRYTAHIIADIALHKAGAFKNREDYRRALAQYKQDNDPVMQQMLNIMREQRDAAKRPQLGRGTL